MGIRHGRENENDPRYGMPGAPETKTCFEKGATPESIVSRWHTFFLYIDVSS